MIAGSGGFTFNGTAAGRLPSSTLTAAAPGTSTINMTTPGNGGVLLHFVYLDEGIDLDLGESGQQAIPYDLATLGLLPDGHPCAVDGTPYDDTIETSTSGLASVYGCGGNDTLEANGTYNVLSGGARAPRCCQMCHWASSRPITSQFTMVPSATLVVNDATQNDPCIDPYGGRTRHDGMVVEWNTSPQVVARLTYMDLPATEQQHAEEETCRTAGNLTVTGGTQLDLGDGTTNLGSLNVSGGSTVFGGTVTATSYSVQGSTIYADLGDPSGGTAGLTASGNVTLVGQNTFSGTTTIQSGSNAADLGDGWNLANLSGGVADGGT